MFSDSSKISSMRELERQRTNFARNKTVNYDDESLLDKKGDEQTVFAGSEYDVINEELKEIDKGDDIYEFPIIEKEKPINDAQNLEDQAKSLKEIITKSPNDVKLIYKLASCHF